MHSLHVTESNLPRHIIRLLLCISYGTYIAVVVVNTLGAEG